MRIILWRIIGKNRIRIVVLGERVGGGIKMSGERRSCGWNVLYKRRIIFNRKGNKERKILRSFIFEYVLNKLFT